MARSLRSDSPYTCRHALRRRSAERYLPSKKPLGPAARLMARSLRSAKDLWEGCGVPGGLRSASLHCGPSHCPARPLRERPASGPLPLYLSGGGQAPRHPTPLPQRNRQPPSDYRFYRFAVLTQNGHSTAFGLSTRHGFSANRRISRPY